MRPRPVQPTPVSAGVACLLAAPRRLVRGDLTKLPLKRLQPLRTLLARLLHVLLVPLRLLIECGLVLLHQAGLLLLVVHLQLPFSAAVFRGLALELAFLLLQLVLERDGTIQVLEELLVQLLSKVLVAVVVVFVHVGVTLGFGVIQQAVLVLLRAFAAMRDSAWDALANVLDGLLRPRLLLKEPFTEAAGRERALLALDEVVKDLMNRLLLALLGALTLLRRSQWRPWWRWRSTIAARVAATTATAATTTVAAWAATALAASINVLIVSTATVAA